MNLKHQCAFGPAGLQSQSGTPGHNICTAGVEQGVQGKQG
jgi:hypothetical protein